MINTHVARNYTKNNSFFPSCEVLGLPAIMQDVICVSRQSQNLVRSQYATARLCCHSETQGILKPPKILLSPKPAALRKGSSEWQSFTFRKPQYSLPIIFILAFPRFMDQSARGVLESFCILYLHISRDQLWYRDMYYFARIGGRVPSDHNWGWTLNT